MSRRHTPHKRPTPKPEPVIELEENAPDWDTPCQVCDQVPTVHPLELCGPCCFGEAATAGGNW